MRKTILPNNFRSLVTVIRGYRMLLYPLMHWILHIIVEDGSFFGSWEINSIPTHATRSMIATRNHSSIGHDLDNCSTFFLGTVTRTPHSLRTVIISLVKSESEAIIQCCGCKLDRSNDLRDNENRKRQWNRLLWNQMHKVGAETLHQKHGLHPIQVRGMGLTLQHNMMLSAAPAALVAWFPAPWRSTLPTLLGAALRNRLQPKSCLLHRKTIQMAGYGLGADLERTCPS